MQYAENQTSSVEEEREYEAIDSFCATFDKQLKDAIRERTTVDKRMAKDMQMYHGKYDPALVQQLSEEERSALFINILRAKTDVGEAQLVDLLFQSNEKNWGIDPTPQPDLVSKIGDNTPAKIGDTELVYADTGETVRAGDIALREMEIAREAAGRMEKVIDDQLTEADYANKSRMVIHDACVVGTGIMKGPVVTGKIRRGYQQRTEQGGNVFAAVIEQYFDAGVEVVRPWDFFPDPSAATISECEYTFERRYLSRKQVRDLKIKKGFSKKSLRRVLAMTPEQTQHRSVFSDDTRVAAGLSTALNDTRYELWEYHGPIPMEMVQEWLEYHPEAGIQLTQEMLDDPMNEITGIVHYCGGVVLSVKLHLIDYDQSFPYRVFNWIPDDSSIFGYGIPYVCAHPQELVNASIRMMMDNAAITTGPQLGMNRSKISPVDGDWKLKPFKLWDIKGSATNINEVMSKMEFNSHTAELQSIYQLARVLIDETSGLPMIQHGEQGQSTQTLGGMSMLMNAANTVRRRQVKLWDDNITCPLVSDFYRFNMQFSDDETIKGDYNVYARGTSALLVKEQAAQAITAFIGMVGSAAPFQPVLEMKAREILQAWAATQPVLPESIVPTQEEFDAFEQKRTEQMSQQVDPQMQVEQVRTQQIELRFQKQAEVEQMRQQSDMRRLQGEAQLKMLALQEQREQRLMQERLEMMRLAQNDKALQDRLIVDLEKLERKLAHDSDAMMFETKLKQIYGPDGNFGIRQDE